MMEPERLHFVSSPESTVRNIIESFKYIYTRSCHNGDGYCFFAASIFAYGQTSSGKTYTMTGITGFAINDIFLYIDKVTHTNF